MKTDRLELAAARRVLGLILREDLPAAAEQALEDGCDSPSLRMLAGLTGSELDEAAGMFDRSLDELGVERPSTQVAVRRLARDSAEKILSGATTPNEGARRIWLLCECLGAGESLLELHPFIYWASEWDERPANRQLFEQGITAAARDLLSFE